MFNDYLSPDILPTSPRINNHENKKITVTGSIDNHRLNGFNKNKNVYLPSESNSDMITHNSNYDQSEKSKTTSRCFIRPKDLPGYKNY
jgi:hypothetical protein